MAANEQSSAPASSGTVPVLVTFPLEQPERELIERVDPRIELHLTMRPLKPDAKAPGGGYPAAPEWERLNEAELEKILGQAEVMFGFRFGPSGGMEWLDRAVNLRWVQLSSAGADHVIRTGLFDKRPDVRVTTASGIHEIPISEQVLGYMLAFARRYLDAWRNQQEKKWARVMPVELAGQTLGIFGYGPIARRVATLAKAFGMRVLVTRRSAADPDEQVDRYYTGDKLHEMLPQCDYVLLAAPLTDETRNTIGAPELALIKPGAVLINISRGPMIDEAALIDALQKGRIGGAALDVFDQEPLPPTSPLWSLSNVILTPHVAGSSPVYNRRATELFCANLRAYLSGDPLKNLVDPHRGY